MVNYFNVVKVFSRNLATLYLTLSMVGWLVRSLRNFKLKLLGYITTIQTYLVHMGYPKMATIRHEIVQLIKNPSISANSIPIFMKPQT